jgi:prepilin-type N-terminal cleavage/methylation domain-containing protein
MKNSPHHLRHLSRAFTLVEMLVVISIIGILAAMLLTSVSMAVAHAKVRKAQMEIAELVSDINSYHSTYGSYPASSNAVSIANSVNPPDDFTYGATA